jgi:hypothetical protein
MHEIVARLPKARWLWDGSAIWLRARDVNESDSDLME